LNFVELEPLQTHNFVLKNRKNTGYLKSIQNKYKEKRIILMEETVIVKANLNSPKDTPKKVNLL
jgi:hypothetical protein